MISLPDRRSRGNHVRLKLQSQQVGFAAIAVTVAAQQPVVDDCSAAMLLRELQRSVARDDRAAVSALIQYPLTVFAGGVRIPMLDAASLVQSYDVVFSPALKTLISQAAMPARGCLPERGVCHCHP